ncbi:MAG: 4-hydroxy-tetrahydrodipicolinate reductase [Deltaproteobacteria bacterium]
MNNDSHRVKQPLASARLGIAGAAGRMGKAMISELQAGNYPNLKLVRTFVSEGDPLRGKYLNESVRYETVSESSLKNIDVFIDFTEPDATLQFIPLLREFRCPAVIGTTGHSKEQKEEIKKLSKSQAVLLAPNTSIGVHVLISLLENAAKLLPKTFTPHIIDVHHRDKKDAPSGTAKQLSETIRAVRNDVTIESIRGGDVMGEHTILFLGEGERLELTHRAASRTIFARGALEAAQWLITQKPGLYSMKDFLEGTRE